MDSKDARIMELEQQVRELSGVVACIPMAAAGLSIVPLNSLSVADSPLEAVALLEEICRRAEIYQALADAFGPPDEGVSILVAARRGRMEKAARLQSIPL